MKFIKKNQFLFLFILLVCIFFYPFFIQGKLPIPSDTIIGLYHPFRDLYAIDYPNGIAYKNFLITDPVRQQYPWKEFAIESFKIGRLPIWNPYEMSGKPQLANFQTGAFYPLNIILFISPFYLSWSLFILLQPLIGGLGMYYFLRNLKIHAYASFLGAICFAFSGFMIAWLEWGVVGHTYIYLPLLLLTIDKGFLEDRLKWRMLFACILVFSFLAGHLQVFTYVFLVVTYYLLVKLFGKKKKVKILSSFIFDVALVVVITSIQWIPTLFFILQSSRSTDQSFENVGWFIPWQHLLMFFAPDFFGNPSTLNYFGVWNYAEFVGYIGITGIIFALYTILFRRDKKTYFFISLFLFVLLFATPNVISKIPFVLHIPFLSTAQPTRLIGIASFSLAVLAAFGMDMFISKRSKIWVANVIVGGGLLCMFIATKMPNFFPGVENSFIAQNNLKLPFLLFVSSVIILFMMHYFKGKKIIHMLVLLLICITVFDLFRFGWKFTPFTDKDYLFPKTRVISFLQQNLDGGRIAVLDDRILPPNFQTVYAISAISGYDPLYLTDYAQLIAANERVDHNIAPPYGYNRIITPKNYSSQIFDLLNVKYILSFNELSDEKLKLVFQEGQTKVYENKYAFPKAFFVEKVTYAKNTEEIAKQMFSADLLNNSFTIGKPKQKKYQRGEVKFQEATENEIAFVTKNKGEGFLVMSEIYYPYTSVTIDGESVDLHKVNIALTGMIVPSGEHVIRLKRNLF